MEGLGDRQVEVVLDAAEVPPEEGVPFACGLGGGLWGLLAVEHVDWGRGRGTALGIEGDLVGVGLPARDEEEGLGDRQVEVVLDAAEVPAEEGVALACGLGRGFRGLLAVVHADGRRGGGAALGIEGDLVGVGLLFLFELHGYLHIALRGALEGSASGGG